MLNGAAVLVLALSVVVVLLPYSAAWIPFIGQEMHAHHNLHHNYGEWDLVHLVSMNTSQKGVSGGGPGPLNTSTYTLKDTFTDGDVDQQTTAMIVSHLTSEFSCYFVYRQHNNTVATLVSFTEPDSNKPWLQVTSDLKKMRLQLVYRQLGDRRPHQLSVPLHYKTGSTWTKLLVAMNGTQVRIWINCNSVEKRSLEGPVDLKLPEGGLLHFTQKPNFEQKLLGSIQAAKLFNFAMASRVWRCNFDGQFGPNWKPPLLG